MKILVLFVEITDYNIARIENVYKRCQNIEFTYVYCSSSVSGHKHIRELPHSACVLQGNSIQKISILRKLTQQQAYDFVIINGYSELSRLWCIMYCKMHGIPYAIETDTQLQIPNNLLKRLAKSLLLKAIFKGNAYGFAGGTRQKELFYHYGMDKNRVKILPMTVDVDALKNLVQKYEKSYLQEKYNVQDKKVILYVGRFEEVKNLPLLIEAIYALAKKHHDFVVYMVGGGSQERQLKTLINQYHLEEEIQFVGYQVMPKLAEYYALADVFVLPSKFEQWGLVVNEALTCGVPVIASKHVGAVDDLIIGGQNGDVFNAENSDELVELLQKWLYTRTGEVEVDIMQKWNFATYRTILEDTLGEIVTYEN